MRGNFNSSQLVSLLSTWGHTDAQASLQDWAHQLSLWLGPFDAITLQGVHQSITTASASVRPQASMPGAQTLNEALQRVRSDLVNSISAWQRPRPGGSDDTEVAGEFAPYRTQYIELQRRMEWRLDPFRVHCRQVLSRTHSRLKQLADLDAALEQTLTKREKALLSKLPALLEQRFMHLKRHHDDGPHIVGWLSPFEREFRALLLAEMNLRTEPIMGLIEAFANGTHTTQ